MKLLKDAGFQPKRTIRLILGSDEESGSADVPLYLAKEAPLSLVSRQTANFRLYTANAAL